MIGFLKHTSYLFLLATSTVSISVCRNNTYRSSFVSWYVVSIYIWQNGNKVRNHMHNALFLCWIQADNWYLCWCKGNEGQVRFLRIIRSNVSKWGLHKEYFNIIYFLNCIFCYFSIVLLLRLITSRHFIEISGTMAFILLNK